MRFNDETLVQILEAMRTPGGKQLSPAQWQALLKTQRNAVQPAEGTFLNGQTSQIVIMFAIAGAS